MIGGCWRSKTRCWLPVFILCTLWALVFIVNSWEPKAILPLESKSNSLSTLNFSLLQSLFQTRGRFFLILFVITSIQPYFRLTRSRHNALILFGQLNLLKLLIHWWLGLKSIRVRGKGGLSAIKLLILLLTLLFRVISHISFWNIHRKWRIKYLYIYLVTIYNIFTAFC
jgi:hypothetical protein